MLHGWELHAFLTRLLTEVLVHVCVIVRYLVEFFDGGKMPCYPRVHYMHVPAVAIIGKSEVKYCYSAQT